MLTEHYISVYIWIIDNLYIPLYIDFQGMAILPFFFSLDIVNSGLISNRPDPPRYWLYLENVLHIFHQFFHVHIGDNDLVSFEYGGLTFPAFIAHSPQSFRFIRDCTFPMEFAARKWDSQFNEQRYCFLFFYLFIYLFCGAIILAKYPIIRGFVKEIFDRSLPSIIPFRLFYLRLNYSKIYALVVQL